jgi:hypothetical protein
MKPGVPVPVPVEQDITGVYETQREELLAKVDEGLRRMGAGLKAVKEAAAESKALLKSYDELDDADKLSLEFAVK